VNLLISDKHSYTKTPVKFSIEKHDTLLVVSYEREAFFINNM